MRKYLASSLALCLIVLASMLYKQRRQNVFIGFRKADAPVAEPILRLYGFFSSESCVPCGEVISVLNELPDYFQVTGVVPQAEVQEIDRLREDHKIRFPVYGTAKHGRYKPLIVPSIMGVSTGGKVLFVLPCITQRPEEIFAFLMDIHLKLAPLLANGSF